MITLASLRKSSVKPPITTIYGPQKIGKTTLATTFRNPVFIGFEDGLVGIPGVSVWDIDSTAQANEALDVLLNEKHDFSTVVTDTVTSFERVLNREEYGEEGVKNLEKVGGGYSKWRLQVMPKWERYFAKLHELRERRGLEVVLLGHSVVKEIRTPDSDPYMKYGIDLINPHATQLLLRESDIILFVNYTTGAVTGAKKDQNKEVVKAGRMINNAQERMIYATETPGWYAGNRFGLPPEILFDIDGENYRSALENCFK